MWREYNDVVNGCDEDECYERPEWVLHTEYGLFNLCTPHGEDATTDIPEAKLTELRFPGVPHAPGGAS